MIRCWIYRNAIERHLDGEAGLSREAREHVEECAECAAMLKRHSLVVERLRARDDENGEIPFLRARILNAIQSGVETPHSKTLRVVSMAVAVSAAVVVFGVIMLPKEKPVQLQAVAAPPAFDLPKISAPPVELTGSLETELEALKSDTQRAVKALAASFTPSER